MSDVAKELDRIAYVCSNLRFASSDDAIADGVLTPLAMLLAADSAVFRVFSPSAQSSRPGRVVSVGIPAAVNESYLDCYYELDPVQRWLRRREPRPLFTHAGGHWAEEPIAGDYEEFRRYRREFLMPNRFIQHLGFCVWHSVRGACLFDVHRRGSTAFGPLERARARVVAQYLQARVEPTWQISAADGVELGHALTEREAEVADAVARGLSNKQVAAALRISVRTVENHLRSIFGKLRVATRTHLVAKWRH